MPNVGDEMMRMAVQHHQAGRFADAERLYRQLLGTDPRNANAMNLLGVLADQRGDHALALRLIREAIRIKPSAAEFWSSLAWVLNAQGKRDEAIDAARKATELDPNSLVVQMACGQLLAWHGRLELAAEYFRRAVKLNPEFAEGWNELGMALKEQGKFPEAEEAFGNAARIAPGSAKFRTNFGNVLKDQNQLLEAEREFKEAVKLAPDVALVHHNYAVVLAGLGKSAEAIEESRETLRLQPDHAAARATLGHVLMGMGKQREALEILAEGARIQPQDGEAHWNFGWNLLLIGDYERGWPEFEWRWKSSTYRDVLRRSPERQWNGSDVDGRRFLLYSEGGLGDTLHFVRYVPLLAKRGAKVILECQAELVSLLRKVEGVCEILSTGQPTPVFDVICPTMSLPLNFGTTLQTIPAEVPYIAADPTRAKAWESKVPPEPGRVRVGLVWAGNPKNKNDPTRSVGLARFAPLADAKHARFFSVQVGAGAAEASAPPPGMELADFSADLRDFGETAALIANLDLVISVDTSVVHLAGAMGKPIWVLIPFTPDWRWMLGREDCAWYPTMRLFRQRKLGDWEEVLGRVARALRDFEIRNSKFE